MSAAYAYFICFMNKRFHSGLAKAHIIISKRREE